MGSFNLATGVVAHNDSVIRIHLSDDELSPSLPKNSLETAYRLTPPHTDELRFAARIPQSHPASEQRIELVQPNIPFDKFSFTIQVMAFAPLRPIQRVFV
jgi:hypothetical protein